MSTIIGSSIAGTPAYPARPEVKVVMDTPNPHGYTEQSGQYGTRAGTIIPHNDPARSFADQQRPRHNTPISVVAFREPSAQNPFGGFEMLVPPIPSEAITEEIRTQARQRAQQMHSDPVNQGVAEYKLMAELISGNPPAPPPAAAPTEHLRQDPPPAMPPMSMEMMMNMARLFGMMQAQQPVPAPVPLPVAATPPPAPAPIYPPPGQPTLPPSPPPPVPVPILDSLLIPGLGAVPSKPLAQVQFDLGPLGNQMSFWHWVVETKTALCLVFDTRYDYPMWTPPNLGAEQPINVTLHNTQKGPLAVPCFSCGLNFRFGVFECTILVVASDG